MSLPDPRERRTVTVLFSDLSGFTRLAGGLDPEDVGDLVDALFRRLRAIVERHGGTVDKFIGDAVMAVFGAPVAHADNAARAVRAGLAMQREMAAFNAERRTSLAMRIGLNTGEVLWGSVGGDRPTAIGDAVNLAQRLEAAAAPGAVLAAAATARAASAAARWGPKSSVAVRGRDEPLDVREALGDPDGRGDLTSLTLRAGPLVGREPEWARLSALLDAPGPAFVLLRGSAGVGKSRLLAEFRTLAASRGHRVSTGRALEAARVWCGPFAEIIRSEAGASSLDESGEARIVEALGESLAAVEPDGVQRENAAHLVALAIGCAVKSARVRQIEPARIPAETRHAWLRWLEGRARTRPSLLCIEDFHWADSGTRAVLEAATALPAGLPLLVIATARPGVDPPAGFEVMELREFDEAATARCAAALLGGPPDAALSAWLAEKSGGNAYFVEALARHLAAEGLVEGNPRRLAGPVDRVPDGLAGLLTARLDALPARIKDTVKAASVLGRAFWKGLLGELTGADASAALDEAWHREIVFPQDDSLIPGDAQYVFKHALLRDAAYSLLPRRERARLHALAADRLEARGTAWRLRAMAARHRADAAQPAEAAALWAAAARGALDDFAHEQAAAFAAESLALARTPEGLLVAGRAECQLGRHETALRLLVEAEAAPATRHEALREVQMALTILGRGDDALEANRRMLDSQANHAERFEALVTRMWLLDRFSRLDLVDDALTQARAAIDAAGGEDRISPGAMTDLESLVAYRARRHGLLDEALTAAHRAVAFARKSANPRRVALSLNVLAQTFESLRRFDECLATHAQAEAMLRSLGDRRDLAVCLNNTGRSLEQLDRLPEAERFFAESVALKRSIELRVSLPVTLINLGSVRFALGRCAEGLRDIEEGLALARANGDPRNIAHALNRLSTFELEREDFEAALRRFEEFVAAAAAFTEIRIRLGAQVNFAGAKAQAGLPGVALDTLRDSVRQARETGDEDLLADCLDTFASALLFAGHGDEAAAALRESIACTSAARTQVLPLIRLGTLLRQSGDLPGARKTLDRALEAARVTGRASYEARVRRERALLEQSGAEADAAVEAAKRSGVAARLADALAAKARVTRDPAAAREAVAAAETPAPRARALSALARTLAECGGQAEEAVKALREARETWPIERWSHADRLESMRDEEIVRAAAGRTP